MANIRFMSNNFAGLTTGTVSSSTETTGYENDNIVNDYRSSTWRAAGFFEISDGSVTYEGAANNLLYFNDGTDKTATITSIDPGHVLPSDLAAIIQVDLNAVSSNWTVTYSTTTGKFTIANSGSVTLRETQTTDAIWDTIGFTSGTDNVGTSFEADEQRNHTFEWLKIDMGAQQTIDTVLLVAAANADFPLSSTATLKVQANSTDVWSSPPLDTTLTFNDLGSYTFLTSAVAYRYWRIYTKDRTNTLGAAKCVEYGNVYLGDYDELSARNINRGFQHRKIDPSTISESENSVVYYDKRTKFNVFDNLVVKYAQLTDKATIEDLYTLVGKTVPFYFSLDPETAISTNQSDFTKMVTFQGEPSYTQEISDYYNIGFALREVI